MVFYRDSVLPPGPPEKADRVISGGETFDIVLDDLPQSGYRWRLMSVSPPGILLPHTDPRGRPITIQQHGATRVLFRFEAVGYGLALITIKRARPWMPDTHPDWYQEGVEVREK